MAECDAHKTRRRVNTAIVVLLEARSKVLGKLIEDLRMGGNSHPHDDNGETSSRKKDNLNKADGICSNTKESQLNTAKERKNGGGKDAKKKADYVLPAAHKLSEAFIGYPEPQLRRALNLVPIYLSLFADFVKILLRMEEMVEILKALKKNLEEQNTENRTDHEGILLVRLIAVLDMVDEQVGKAETMAQAVIGNAAIDSFIDEFPHNVASLQGSLRRLCSEGQPSYYTDVNEQCEKALQELELKIKKLVMPTE